MPLVISGARAVQQVGATRAAAVRGNANGVRQTGGRIRQHKRAPASRAGALSASVGTAGPYCARPACPHNAAVRRPDLPRAEQHPREVGPPKRKGRLSPAEAVCFPREDTTPLGSGSRTTKPRATARRRKSRRFRHQDSASTTVNVTRPRPKKARPKPRLNVETNTVTLRRPRVNVDPHQRPELQKVQRMSRPAVKGNVSCAGEGALSRDR
jgi:hypothetical protein